MVKEELPNGSRIKASIQVCEGSVTTATQSNQVGRVIVRLVAVNVMDIQARPLVVAKAASKAVALHNRRPLSVKMFVTEVFQGTLSQNIQMLGTVLLAFGAAGLSAGGTKPLPQTLVPNCNVALGMFRKALQTTLCRVRSQRFLAALATQSGYQMFVESTARTVAQLGKTKRTENMSRLCGIGTCNTNSVIDTNVLNDLGSSHTKGLGSFGVTMKRFIAGKDSLTLFGGNGDGHLDLHIDYMRSSIREYAQKVKS